LKDKKSDVAFEVARLGEYPACDTCNTKIFQWMIDQDRFEEALKIYREKRAGCYFPGNTEGLLLKHLIKLERADDAIEVASKIEHAFKHEDACFFVTDELLKRGQVDKALAIFKHVGDNAQVMLFSMLINNASIQPKVIIDFYLKNPNPFLIRSGVTFLSMPSALDWLKGMQDPNSDNFYRYCTEKMGMDEFPHEFIPLLERMTAELIASGKWKAVFDKVAGAWEEDEKVDKKLTSSIPKDPMIEGFKERLQQEKHRILGQKDTETEHTSSST